MVLFLFVYNLKCIGKWAQLLVYSEEFLWFFLTNGMLWTGETCFLELCTSGFLQDMQVQMVQFSKEKGCAYVSRLNSSFL